MSKKKIVYLDDDKNAVQQSKSYTTVAPKQLGNLHERMKYVTALLRKQGPERTDNDLWHAIFDLEIEVSHYQPQDPPYGSRFLRVGPARKGRD